MWCQTVNCDVTRLDVMSNCSLYWKLRQSHTGWMEALLVQMVSESQQVHSSARIFHASNKNTHLSSDGFDYDFSVSIFRFHTIQVFIQNTNFLLIIPATGSAQTEKKRNRITTGKKNCIISEPSFVLRGWRTSLNVSYKGSNLGLPTKLKGNSL